MTQNLLCLALIAGSFISSAIGAEPSSLFSPEFSIGANLPHKNLPSCGWDKPSSLRPKRLCASAGNGAGLFIAHNVESLKQFPADSIANPQLNHPYLWVDAQSNIQGIQIWTESSGHNRVLSYLIKKFGEPERSSSIIGSFMGAKFDQTGKPVSSEYTWSKPQYKLTYRPYRSSNEYRTGTITLESEAGKKIREEFSPESREALAARTAKEKPQAKKICLEGICIGDSVDQLPSSLKWEFARPEDYRDRLARIQNAKKEWDKEAAEAKKNGWDRPDDYQVRNAQRSLDDAIKELKRIYPAGDAQAIQELARRWESANGSFEGPYLKLSDAPLLKKLKFACDEQVWVFRFLSKSGYPTEVFVGYSVIDESKGTQRLQVDAIVRKYPEITGEAALYQHITALEKSIGAEISHTNKQVEAEYPVQLSYGFDKLQINSRNYIQFFQKDNLAKHPGCSGRVSVD